MGAIWLTHKMTNCRNKLVDMSYEEVDHGPKPTGQYGRYRRISSCVSKFLGLAMGTVALYVQFKIEL